MNPARRVQLGATGGTRCDATPPLERAKGGSSPIHPPRADGHPPSLALADYIPLPSHFPPQVFPHSSHRGSLPLPSLSFFPIAPAIGFGFPCSGGL